MPQPRLTLFTRPDCPPCDWLKTWLRERNLQFEEYDVSTDKIAVFTLVRRYRSQSTPTLVVADDEILIGFEPEKIEAALAKHNTAGQAQRISGETLCALRRLGYSDNAS